MRAPFSMVKNCDVSLVYLASTSSCGNSPLYRKIPAQSNIMMMLAIVILIIFMAEFRVLSDLISSE
jgi:hypothetical protein